MLVECKCMCFFCISHCRYVINFTFVSVRRFILLRLSYLRVAAGGESHHQLPGLSGAVNRSRKAGGSLGGKLRPGLPLGHRGRRAPQTGQLHYCVNRQSPLITHVQKYVVSHLCVSPKSQQTFLIQGVQFVSDTSLRGMKIESRVPLSS